MISPKIYYPLLPDGFGYYPFGSGCSVVMVWLSKVARCLQRRIIINIFGLLLINGIVLSSWLSCNCDLSRDVSSACHIMP